jgi:magnesium-transporting ATPase (P-type)
LRHRSDRIMNFSKARVLKNSKFIETYWKDIRCGDLIEVNTQFPFPPCDLVLLYSHTDDGICQITTANLDGETNLKVFLS